MDQRIRSIRSQTRKFARVRAARGTRYPAALRDEAVTIARERQAHGMAVSGVARELGLWPDTLIRWLRSASHHRVRTVTIRPEPVQRPTQPVLVTPQGLRVEGLDLDGVAHLLRSLA